MSTAGRTRSFSGMSMTDSPSWALTHMLISTPISSRDSCTVRIYASCTNIWEIRADISSVVMPSGTSVEDTPSTRKNTGVLCIRVYPGFFLHFSKDRAISLSISAASVLRGFPKERVASVKSRSEKAAGTVSATSRMRMRLSCSAFCKASTTALCRLCLSIKAPPR